MTERPAWADGAMQLPLIKAHLRIDGSDQDALLAMHWEAAIDELDGPAGRLNRSLVPRVREAWLSRVDAIQPLPLRPVIRIVSVEERQADGSLIDVPIEGAYELIGDHQIRQSRIALFGCPERVMRYVAGYAEAPARLIALLLLMVENRVEPPEPNRARAIESMVRAFRLPGVG